MENIIFHPMVRVIHCAADMMHDVADKMVEWGVVGRPG